MWYYAEMLRNAGVLAVGLLCSCAPSEGVSDTIQLRYFSALEQHPQETLDAAAEILGLEIVVLAPGEEGWAILAQMHDSTDNIGGQTTSLGRCARTFWARDNARSVAHEIGHALGLLHIDDPNNLMYLAPPGTEVSVDQEEQMRRGAWTINHCGRFQGRTENRHPP